MRIGFLGTGTISKAIVCGLCRSDFAVEAITVSPRNAQIAKGLADAFPLVTIAQDNQQVVDRSDIIFIGLRGQIAQEVLRGLEFRTGQKLVTLIATATSAKVAEWTGNVATILRAVPLPFVAEHKSATPIYPADPDLSAIFAHIGGFIAVDDEHKLNLFMTAGSLMGVYFRFLQTSNYWMMQKGLSYEQSKTYLVKLFASLADTSTTYQKADFPELEREYSTKGGTNELVAELFAKNGGTQALENALEAAFLKISNS